MNVWESNKYSMEDDLSERDRFYDRTKAVVEEHSIEWKLNDLSALVIDKKHAHSAFSESRLQPGCYYYFRLTPVAGGESIGLFSLYFLTRCYDEVTLEVDSRCSVSSLDGACIVKGLRIRGTSPQNAIGVHMRLKTGNSDLWSRVREDNGFVIMSEFTVRHKALKIHSVNLHFEPDKIPWPKDLEISCHDGSQLVHGALLAMKLPKLINSVITSPAATPHLRLDIPISLARRLIEYVYTDRISDFDMYARELLPLANLYGAEELKRKCAISIWKNITDSNAADTYHLAVDSQCPILEKRALNYIAVNPLLRAGSNISPTLKYELDELYNQRCE